MKNLYLPVQHAYGGGINLFAEGPGRFQASGNGLECSAPVDNGQPFEFSFNRWQSTTSYPYYKVTYSDTVIDGDVEFGNAYIKINGGVVATGTTYEGETITLSGQFYMFNHIKSSWSNWIRSGHCGQVIFLESGVETARFTPYEDDNGDVGFLDENNQTMIYSMGNAFIAGPDASSIGVDVSKTVVKAAGDTIPITVNCKNAWTISTSGNSFLTLSATGGTSGETTITATAPNYTGVAPREEYLTFTDSVTGDYVEVSIKQKKYVSGQPLYLGADEILEIYLGIDPITEAYLGTELVYSSGAFTGLIVDPMNIEFHTLSLTSEVKVKSSEAWTMTLPAWISASATGGTSGETTIYLSATTQSSYTSGTVAFTTTNFQTDAKAEFNPVEYMDYVWATQMGSSKLLSTGIYPTLQTKGEVLYEQKTYSPGTVIVGMYGDESGWDNRDWRLFYTYGGDKWAFDIANSRLEDTFGGGWLQNKEYDIEFGNNYLINHTDNLSASTDTVQSGQLDNLPVDINVGMVWVKEVKLWEGNTLVYDGKAAKVGDDYGLIDVVTGHFLTGDDFNLTGATITPTPTGKTLTINSVAIANSMGETIYVNVENNGTGYLTYCSSYDDSRQEADNTFSVPTGYTYTFDAGNGVITFTGPFDLAGGYEVICERSSPDMGTCEFIHYSFPVVWTGDAATVNADFAPQIDPECECVEQGGTWDGSECVFDGGEDACGGDPCCEQGISDPNECDCMMNGGWWDGSECHYD